MIVSNHNVNFQTLWNKFLASPALVEPGLRYLLNVIKDLREENAALREKLGKAEDPSRNVGSEDSGGSPSLPESDVQPSTVVGDSVTRDVRLSVGETGDIQSTEAKTNRGRKGKE